VAAKPDYDGAKAYALSRLEDHLSPLFSYHSLYHTRDDVLPAAERLALLEGVSAADLLLLRTAVLYHDLGFTIQVDNHEWISAHIAGEVLPSFHYLPQQVQKIQGMILVTKLFTPPQTLLEAIMVDADLDVLGREDFLKRNQDLRTEIARLGKSLSDEQWYTQQLKFMHIHRYRTISAQTMRNPLKYYHINLITGLLAACSTSQAGEGSNGRSRTTEFHPNY